MQKWKTTCVGKGTCIGKETGIGRTAFIKSRCVKTHLNSVLKNLAALSVVIFFAHSQAFADNYQSHPEAEKFIEEMVQQHGFQADELQALFTATEKKQSILDAIARPAEKTLSWKEYRDIFVVPSRIDKGTAFWQTYRADLERAEQEFGVPVGIVVAVIGVETRYGENKGNYRVMDALATLAFDYPPRSSFFRKELQHFLILTQEQKQDPLALNGSYAGAMGYGQFMPSSFRSYAVDFDGDGLKDIWNNPVDAIGSVANYLSRHGWERGELIAVRARINSEYDKNLVNDQLQPQHSIETVERAGFSAVESVATAKKLSVMRLEGANGAEFWLGLQNFYVITRYNHSAMYAMAVYQLGQSIEIALNKMVFESATNNTSASSRMN